MNECLIITLMAIVIVILFVAVLTLVLTLVFKETRQRKDSQRKVSDFACLMTKDEWLENISNGSIMNNNGYGYYSDGTYQYGYVRPSNIIDSNGELIPENFDKRYTHVAWYNK